MYKPLWDLRIQRVQRVVVGAINYCRRPFIKELSNGPQARLARFLSIARAVFKFFKVLS